MNRIAENGNNMAAPMYISAASKKAKSKVKEGITHGILYLKQSIYDPEKVRQVVNSGRKFWAEIQASLEKAVSGVF